MSGATRVLTTSIAARLPLPMLGIGLLVHAQRLTGSFAAAGLVTAAYAVASGAGGPLLGRLVDRHGQTRVLLASTVTAASLLLAIALAPAGASTGLLAALAAGIGFTLPPAGACVRALLPGLWTDPERVRVAYAVDATASELTWIAGPPLALTIGAVFSPGAAIAAAAVILLAGTAAFALQPASRHWRPEPAERRGGSMRAPGMRTLVLVLLGAGALFGAVEVAIADAAGGAAGPLLGLWGAGSLVGGALATRLGGGADDARGLIRIVAALAAGHLALVPAAGSTAALAAVLFVAGAAIAPTFATAYGMVDRVAPAGTVTEAFSWLATALAVGSAAGSAAGGALTEHAGPTAALLLAGIAGAVATIIAALRATSLNPEGESRCAEWSSPSRTVPVPSAS